LAQLLLESPKDFSKEARQRREMEREKLVKEVEHIEGALARHVAGWAGAPGVEYHHGASATSDFPGRAY